MQVLGIFALVASIVFVGMQLRQSQQIATSQALQSRVDGSIPILLTSAENPYFVSAFDNFFLATNYITAQKLCVDFLAFFIWTVNKP